MGWALVPTSWFTDEYNKHLADTTTYKCIVNFNLTSTVTNSNKSLRKLQLRFNKLLTTTGNKRLLNTNPLRQTTTTLHETPSQST